MQNLNTNDDKYKNNKDSKDIPAISTRIGQPIPKIQRIVWIKLNIANINGINFNKIISVLLPSCKALVSLNTSVSNSLTTTFSISLTVTFSLDPT